MIVTAAAAAAAGRGAGSDGEPAACRAPGPAGGQFRQPDSDGDRDSTGGPAKFT
jgi:hypothetical protein